MKEAKAFLNHNETIRLAVVTLLIALNFGILNFMKDRTTEGIDIYVILMVISLVFTKAVLFVFLIYIVTLGISKLNTKTKFRKIYPFFYDMGIVLTIVTILLAVLISIGIAIFPVFNNNRFFIYGYTILVMIVSTIFIYNLIEPYIIKIKSSKKKKKMKKYDFKFWIPLLLTVFSIIIAFYLSTENTETSIKLAEESLNRTFYMTSPVILNATNFVNATEGRWYINVTNTHPFKETGQLFFYRLELDPHRPFMVVNQSLYPGESRVFSTEIKQNYREIRLNSSSNNSKIPILIGKYYYVLDHASITSKISCYNCESQGIVLKLPEYSKFSIGFKITENGTFEDVGIVGYDWYDVKPEEIFIN